MYIVNNTRHQRKNKRKSHSSEQNKQRTKLNEDNMEKSYYNFDNLNVVNLYKRKRKTHT